MNGFMGKILVVDLSKQKTSVLPIDASWSTKVLGGSGYASYLLRRFLTSDCAPLAPENSLVFMTGPLTGTRAPCSGRHTVCGRSPITGLWGESHTGGHFGANLKFSGFDGILVTGRAENPLMLCIEDGMSWFEPADHLWGMKTSQIQEIVREKLGSVQISCIGPAGENLVKYASIVNGERTAARCGMGAVMGSKNLKAITVRGQKRVQLADADAFESTARSVSNHLRATQSTLREHGTAWYIDIATAFNDMSVRYFQELEFDDAERINASALDALLVGRRSCHSCPIGCGRRISIPSLSIGDIAGPEYQSIASLGSNLLIGDIERISYMNHLCNEYGMDTISCGNTIAFATYLDELGKSEYGLKWGDVDSTISLIHSIARRNGIGDVLAEGALSVGRRHNAEELVLHVHGLEVPNHDPRSFFGMATVYAIASRGASHLEGDMYSIDMGTDVKRLGIVGSDRLTNAGKGRTAALAQDFRAFYDSLILCHFAAIPIEDIVSLVRLAIGIEFDIDDILRTGSRVVTQKRLINLELGLDTQDEKLPTALVETHPESVTSNLAPDVDYQLNDYYTHRRWDRETGRPRQDALKDLNLDT